MTRTEDQWEAWVSEAQARRDGQLPKQWVIPKDQLPGEEVKNVVDFPETSGLLSDLELEITACNVPSLIEKIEQKVWTSEQVATAFCHRAAIAQQLTNCLSVMLFEDGIQRAKELDEFYEREGRLMGPLHGIPVSLKDCHNLKGYHTGIGLASYSVGEPASSNSLLADFFLSKGAVLYCKTTVPTAMMMGETDTRVMGRTVSPYNRDAIVGGSSGGEGALAALKGAPVGMGSDIAGSIRIPSAHNLIYGLKGTSHRISNAGTRSVSRGMPFFTAITGPMANDIDSVEYLAKLLFDANLHEKDNSLVPIPWRQPELPEKLAFGIIWDDGVCRPHGAVTRAMRMAVEALKRQGHDVVEWEPIKAGRMNELQEIFFSADGAADFKRELKGEPLLPHQLANREITFRELPSGETYSAQNERIDISIANLHQWNETSKITSTGRPIDGLISPTAIAGGIPHHTFQYVGYTAYWNAMDYPSTVFPVTTVDLSIDRKPDGLETPLHEREAAFYKSFDESKCNGGAIGLQMITQRYQDEKSIHLARIVRDALICVIP